MTPKTAPTTAPAIDAGDAEMSEYEYRKRQEFAVADPRYPTT
jgi:hypothetical protein